MCDYSLAGVPNRLAKVGDELVLYRFEGSKGLADLKQIEPKGFWAGVRKLIGSEKVCAVCIPDGAKISLSDIPAHSRNSFGVSSTEEVIFRQFSQDSEVHRDGIVFRNGHKVKLQYLPEGIRATVLSLEGSEEKEPVQEFVASRR